MAKKVSGHAYKGTLEVGQNGRTYIHEIKKDDVKTYDLTSVIEEYDGREVTFAVNESIEPRAVDLATEDEEEDYDE